MSLKKKRTPGRCGAKIRSNTLKTRSGEYHMSITKILNSYARTLVVGFALATVSLVAVGQQRSESPIPLASTSAQQMTNAAVAFLASLDEAQRDAITYEFTPENRTNWSNVPPYVHRRPGLRIAALTNAQRQAAHELLRASMSSQGYLKVTGVMRLDSIHGARSLAELDRVGPAEDDRPYVREEAESFGAGSYVMAIFGDPDRDADWSWLIQGHHMGATFTVSDGRTGFTPLFLGATPLVLEQGVYAGWSAMSHEVTRGFELMQALDSGQRAAATQGDTPPNDVLAGVGRKDNIAQHQGLQSSEMSAEQQSLLRVLVEEYVRNSDFDAAEAQLDAIAEAGWDNLWFSWHGQADDPAGPLFYRVQGERILIELTQRPNHIHTIVRDPANDYGERWLGQTLTEEYSAGDRFEAAVRAYEASGGNL